MTCLVCLDYAKAHRLDLKKTLIIISKAAINWKGSSTNLQQSDQVYLINLLHAMMLVNGNDAAYALAEFFGKEILLAKGMQIREGLDQE